MATRLMAGGAKVAVTPPMGSAFQSSRADLRVESVYHDLYATAVVLSDGEHKVAIVGLDVLGLDAPLVNAVRERVSRQSSIPGASVLINASHSHFGPAILQALPDEIDETYYQSLVQSLADAVTRADASLEPVALRVGAAEGNFAINRRRMEGGEAQLAPNYDGIVDQRIRAMRFERLDGTVVAILFSGAFHPTGYAYRMPVVNGDYVAAARQEVERQFADQGAPVVGFLQGCAGNMRVRVIAPGGTRFHPCSGEEIDTHGRGVGALAARAAREATMVVGYPIGVAHELVSLPLMDPPTAAELKDMRAKAKDDNYMQLWTGSMLSRLQSNGSLPTSVDFPIQVLRIGGLWMVGLGAEVFLEVGLQIEAALMADHVGQAAWTLGYSNDTIGYLCTEASYADGGYEPTRSHKFYHLPAPYQPQAEHIVVSEALRIAGTLA
ncbi:MAG: neutral/alkaline non-lysosomal ceramidase N-terminal domain-containing protein [Chloroflexi bacterium]|nr:neutral/alkaline non-lysosomal ceramidase N-terminal domain-containing protein [Chloroflexota bacterium]